MTRQPASRPRTPSRVRSVRLTPRGVCVLALGAIGVIAAYSLGRPELLYPAVLALLLPLAAIALTRFRRIGLTVTRTFAPAVASVGLPVVVELRIANTSPVTTPQLMWRDARPWGHAAASLLAPLKAPGGHVARAGSVRIVRYEVTPPRRGVFTIGPLGVSISDPFELATGEVAVGDTDRLVVAPAITALPDTGLSILASDGPSLLVRRSIGGDDDVSTREYRTGDALRRVHWRATARHGELMVRQEEPRSHAEARVILDTRASGYSDAESRPARDEPTSRSFEVALAMASSVALHLGRGGFEVELVESGYAQLEPVHPLGPFLTSLALVDPTPERGDHHSGSPLHAASRMDRAHGSVFAILADADGATLDRLVAQRPSFDLAVAFVVSAEPTLQLARLEMAGWTCVTVAPADAMSMPEAVERAWRAVAEAQGARFVR
ncbi:MAG: hypothetical protein RI885_2443 [Actinomycetota bacterium]|jgi:uncharacterized protein (DUF58 family)